MLKYLIYLWFQSLIFIKPNHLLDQSRERGSMINILMNQTYRWLLEGTWKWQWHSSRFWQIFLLFKKGATHEKRSLVSSDVRPFLNLSHALQKTVDKPMMITVLMLNTFLLAVKKLLSIRLLLSYKYLFSAINPRYMVYIIDVTH